MRIALLGAESTGKTTLARELASHFNASGRTAIAVPEVLRERCEQERCALAVDDLLAIARQQEGRIDDAASQAQVVIADTTALMVAVYGAILFDDHPLMRFAIDRLRGFDAVLVTGLDLPWVDDGLQRDVVWREDVDAQVRGILNSADIAFRVVYGRGAERLRNALAAIDRSVATRPIAAGWSWSCEKCSDPACEKHLFTQLLNRN